MYSYTSVTKDFPRCGACIYWSGEREVLGNLVQYNSYSCGRCNNVISPAHGENVSADHYCLKKEDFS